MNTHIFERLCVLLQFLNFYFIKRHTESIINLVVTVSVIVLVSNTSSKLEKFQNSDYNQFTFF